MASTKTSADGGETGENQHLDAPDKEAKRIHRALDSFYHVESADEPGAYHVHSGSGSTYTVNLLEGGSCTCPDAERSAMCKHLFRVVAVTGKTPLDAGDDRVAVTLTADGFEEVASAVDVIDAGEEIVGAFDGDGDTRMGALTEQQCADAADALKMAMDMGGPMGADDPAAAADAREALETAGDN
ncbi:SWIM zinc finger family protein [Halococcus sp. IIIV-5B]|uniref:SWIM zinc finger family protein n=1 Tax=Halococcus sp. IIIV-5B TaxID=2321230 RepID=UPI000E73BAEB|nr:SWIM zinc finger family protein [Halococcus sp. IIIV-5B]RJT04714.1 hypothetical protein D3261_08885 [Halococcus sp. IIIV-5B]